MTRLRPADNPFRVQRLDRLRYRLTAHERRALFARLLAERRGALIGPHGSGKTTLLEELATALRERGEAVRLLRLHGNEPTERAAWRAFLARPAGQWLLLDGAEQLGLWGRTRLRSAARRAAGLLVTAHGPLPAPLRLPVLREHATTPALLVELIGELTQPADAERWRARADALYREHQGNLRDCLMACYDLAGREGL